MIALLTALLYTKKLIWELHGIMRDKRRLTGLQTQPVLTVIMPCYNMERYLPRALNALLRQTDPNFKLLIVNDGSTDRTKEIAESYQDRFRDLTIINKKQNGLSAARNVGMACVTTPFFTFHDGDDWVEPGYTSFFRQAFANYPQADMVCCGYYVDTPKGSRMMGKRQSGSLTRWQTYRKMTSIFSSPVKGYTWNKAYRQSVVQAHHLRFVSHLAFMEDQIFNVDYIAAAGRFYYDSRPLYHYYQRSDSMVHDFSFKMVPDNIKANYEVWHRIITSLAAEHKHKSAQLALRRRKHESTRQWR